MPAHVFAGGWLRRFRLRAALRHDRVSPAGEELEALAAAIDLAALSPDQFIQLLETLHMLGQAGAGIDLRSMRTEALVDLVAKASKAQLKALVKHDVLRPLFLDEVFRRMSEHLIVSKVEDLSLCVSWRFTTGEGDEGYDRYQTVIEDGLCVSAEDLGRVPDTTVTLAAYDFLKMATGNAAVASMFVTGKVKVKGDYSLAATFSSYFDIPNPR